MRFKRNILQASVLAAFIVPMSVQAASLEERVSDLEDALMLSEEANEELRLEMDSSMKVSGYADIEYIVEEDKDSRFRMHHLSLFFKKQLDEKWKFFSEIEFEDGPKFEGPETAGVLKADEGKIFVEAVNLDYQLRPEAILRFGRFFTPAGIWSVDHYPPFVSTQERPGHIRKVFPQLIDGAMVYGTHRMGDSFLNYDAFVGNGEGNDGHGDNNGEKALGLKVSLVIPVKGLKYFEVGTTVYTDTLEVTGGGQRDKTAIGFHAKVRVSDFTLQAESASAEFDPTGGAATKGDVSGYYGQLIYSPNQWSGGLRHDFYDSDESGANDKTTNTAFVNYRFSQNTVAKVEYHQIDKEGASEKTNKTIFSIVTYLE